MKRDELRGLIEEHMVLSNRVVVLRKELEKAENRRKEVAELLCGFRSKKFVRSVLSCLIERRNEHGKNKHYDDLLHMTIHSLRHSKDIDAKEFASKRLLRLYDEEVE